MSTPNETTARRLTEGPQPEAQTVIAFGEILVDQFRDREVLGGAPFNVACHLGALGAHPVLVTRTGQDALGDTLLRAMRVNADPIWGLTLGDGLTAAAEPSLPLCECRDADGVRHQLGAIDDPEQLDPVRLDERVREQLRGEPLDDRPGGRLVRRGHRELDAATHPDAGHPLDAQMRQAALHRTTLGIQDAGLGGDVHGESECAGPVGHAAITSSPR